MPLSIKDSKFIVSGNASLKFSNALIDEKMMQMKHVSIALCME